ncbi:hypothetical protein [Mesonia aestuariivivens]|uniref:Uncharacterized protein n=1 Tax=Mesonia aestuariivivens TaxID=2796128 RepID=A0ABS6W581_9FLAO|nr:hypothetical protein [Mesonia aestuariivivens]MBW2962278.1 hypothetical protein [Mesonia aestuariivivens]
MITKEEAQTLRELTGHDYTGQLDEFFRAKNIRNRKNEFYSKQMLGKVFSGLLANKKVETGIWQFVENLVAKKKAEDEKRNSLLKEAKNLTNVQEAS